MKHIVRETNSLYEIKDSKFYGFLIPIYNQKDVKSKIDELKELYPNATHYCYAYIINGHKKAYDDKEPSGTAGLPMLEVLRKNSLYDVAAVVTRYFGGVLLGGWLTRLDMTIQCRRRCWWTGKRRRLKAMIYRQTELCGTCNLSAQYMSRLPGMATLGIMLLLGSHSRGVYYVNYGRSCPRACSRQQGASHGAQDSAWLGRDRTYAGSAASG